MGVEHDGGALVHAAASVPVERHTPRVVFNASVVALAPELGGAQACNISGGGMQLRAPEMWADRLKVGDPLTLSFALPGGESMTPRCEVVWLNRVASAGSSHVSLGVRFAWQDPELNARMQRFIADFRHRVVAVGLRDRSLVESALGDLYPLAVVDSQGALRGALAMGDVGLVIIGEEGGENAARLGAILDIFGEEPPPVVYYGDAPSPELEALFDGCSHVVMLRAPATRLELRTVAQRLIETHVAVHENRRLQQDLARMLERTRRENVELKRQVIEPSHSRELIGESPAVLEIHAMIQRIASLKTTVMISGESGTGKELVARAIHAASSRAGAAFVVQNCAAITETLLDSEFFGHAKGAFTGAHVDHPGLFEAAHGGTIFLDEIGEMTPMMQAKLLRVLQDGEVRRVGSTKSRYVDVRVVCATHRNLEEMIQQEKFREDLYFRLCGFVIRLPPLRARSGDIALLASHFAAVYARRHGRTVGPLSAEVLELLEAYPWPGNVRELEHVMERLVIMSGPDGVVQTGSVRTTLRLGGDTPGPAAPEPQGLDAALETYERHLIVEALTRSAGRITQAATLLGVNRTTLSKRCKRLAIQIPRSSASHGDSDA